MECRVWVAEGRVRVRVHHRVRADAGCGWMVHKGLLRCEGRRTERTQSTWRDPTVEAQRRKEKAFPPPTASSLLLLRFLLKSHRSAAPQDRLSLGGRHTRPSLPVLIFVRPNNNKFVLSLRVYVRLQYQYPSIMYRIYLQRQNRQLFPAASVTPPPPAPCPATLAPPPASRRVYISPSG